ncbi:MAG: type I 3-dehydroquinate dehydratase [Candidatus Bathyarchaeota archaeon]|nr:MAG: type I 3-dehydroquinate dehydratase [Candidatus Bathyarchaeota archaeon]
MTVKICASVIASKLKTIKETMEKAEKNGANLIEIRMDHLREKSILKKVRQITDLPLIATNRSTREGGVFEGSESRRIQQLFDAANSDFDYIDVELSTENSKIIIQRLADVGAQTIISSHNYSMTPDLQHLHQLFQEELSTHADICKIVTLANTFQDNVRCLQFLDEGVKKGRLTAFCMGKIGVISRLLSPLFGGEFTYASVYSSKETAPGQLTITEMRMFYEVLGV